jgi:Tol biopolymer transport system component
MDDLRSVIERGLARAGSDSYTLESFYRKRDRKRSRQRLTAAIVGLAIAIGMVVVGSAILRSAPEDKDVGREGPRILREGEVLQVEDPFSPAATLVATDPATGHQRVLHGCGDCGWIQQFNLSTDRRWIAWESCGSAGCGTTEGGGLWVAGADGTTILVTSSVHPEDILGGWIWAWSPAGDQLAFATGRSSLAELVLFDPGTGERTSVTTVDGISALSWSPDGTAIAMASSSSGVFIVDLASGRSTSIPRVGTIEDDPGVSWSPDGTRLALASHGSIIVVNTDGSDRRTLLDHGGSLGAAWSPDGTRIAYLRTPGSAYRSSLEVWVIGADGSDPTRLFHGECCLLDLWWGPIWSPDGHRIGFYDDADVPFGSELTVNADGSGSPEVVDDVVVDGWIQG